MKIFLDTNIIIDLAEERSGCQIISSAIMELSSPSTRFYISSLTMSNAAYILRRHLGDSLHDRLLNIFNEFSVLPVGDMQVMGALKMNGPDFEDNLQIMCAEDKGCDLIITRNVKHFRPYTDIPVYSPEEFRAILEA